MQNTVFHEIEETGEKTLDIISEAGKFNKWIYSTIKPFCKGRVMEIGSGLGNISGFFLQDNLPIMLTDVRQVYCEKLHDRFYGFPNLLGVENIDLVYPDFDLKYKELIDSFDSVFAINVIEHINDDDLAIENCFKLLKTGGNLIIMVPSYKALFNGFDLGLGHFRRYTLKSISKILVRHNFNIIHKQYFNFIGLIGWFISGRVQKNKSIPKGQMGLYNRFVPIFRFMDILMFRSFGLSAIVVGEKSERL
jgi:SAM-dependent methyltransferase